MTLPALRRALALALRLTLMLTLTVGVLAPSTASAARPLELGFFDGVFTDSTDGATWLARAAAAGSDLVRINIGWVAPNTPTRPPNFDARNPADPNYDFTRADAAVKEASTDGMRVILNFTGAPEWAEGPNIPAGTAPGSWRPNPSDIEDYAIALARRYSGSFPDPADPYRTLPKVWAFQLWNEPNLPDYLSPQWVGQTPASPGIYRGMLNAFYAGIKSIDPSALVVTAGTAPFGDPGTGLRIMPAMFWRDVLCLRQTATGALVGTGCRDPAHFDVLAHHPYSVGAPDTPALNPDDVSIPDMWKLTAILRAAERTGGALPHIHHQLWVTETGYNTNPPNPGAVPMAEDALWVEQDLWLLWRQGVSLITWNTIVDQPPIPSYGATSQSGMYFLDGQPKPGPLTAFRFPFVVSRTSRSRLTIWGRSPAAGRLLIERQAGTEWRAIAEMRVNSHSTFVTQVVDTGPVTLRATVDGQSSLPWRTP